MSDLRGKTLGQYQIIRPIGSGGMATIYRAYQPALDRVVAVKVLPEYLVNQPGFLERFQIEAQAVAKLDHPHIVPIYDYGQVDGVPYLVMKYVEAGTLKEMMNGPIEPRQAAVIVRQIAEALDYAHRQGIIHRDVKPSNVLMQEGRWAQLTDFGLAKILTSTSQLTASGVSVGTPDYMSPEQARGDAIDARSDIYSLGVILYQMLTGDVPFHAETPTGVMLKHVLEPPPPPREINPSISAAVEHVVLRALAKSPDDRFATALALADALEQSLYVSAAGQATVSARPARASPLPLLLGAGAVLVIVWIAFVWLLRQTTPSPAAPTAGAQAGAAFGETLYDDFSDPQIDANRWTYTGTFTTTLNSDEIFVQDRRLAYRFDNAAAEYFDGGARAEPDRAFALISARVTLQDATGFGDIGIQVNGVDPNDPDSWAYLAMAPSDGSIYAYLGKTGIGTQETFTLLAGTGMPATHELAIGWDGAQMTFYVDGQPRKSVTASTYGQYFHLLFDIEPNGRLSGSFDDVRITYSEQ